MTTLRPLEGVLTADMTAGSGTVEVDDPSLAMGTDQIAILAPNGQRVEIMTIGGGSGTHASPWSVSRAQRGTAPATEHHVGAKVFGVNFRLIVGDQDYTMRMNDLMCSDTAPGGDEQLTFKRFVSDPVVLPSLGAPVYLSRSTSTTPGVWTDRGVWTGILEEPAPHYWPKGGADIAFTAHGYSQNLSDYLYTFSKVLDPSTAIPPGLTVAKIIKTALGDLCTLISSDYSLITAGGQGILYPTGDLLAKTALQLVTEYTPLGDAFVPNTWAVRGYGEQSPKFSLVVKDRPVRYQIAIEDTVDGVVIRPRRSDIYTTVIVRWHDGAEEATNEEELVAIGNVRRGILIDASAFIADSDSAKSYAETLAANLSKVKPKAGEVKIKLTKPIYDLILATNIEPWDVISGERLQITKGGVPLVSGNAHIPFDDGFYIRSRTISWSAGELMVATSDEKAELARMLSKLTIAELTRQDSLTKAVLGPMWSNPNSPNLPIPSPIPSSQRLSKDQTDRVAYEDVAEGASTIVLPINWSSGGGTDNPTPLAIGESGSYPVKTPIYLHTCELRITPTDPLAAGASCTVEIKRQRGSAAAGTITLLTTLVISGALELPPITVPDPDSPVVVGGVITYPNTVEKNIVQFVPPVELKADDWLIGTITVNPDPGGARQVFFAGHASKLSGETGKPVDTTPPSVVSVTAGRGPLADVGATFHITTTRPARVQIKYGTISGTPSGWSSFSSSGTDHVLTIPPIPSGTCHYDIVIEDRNGTQTIDAGHVLY